jgi:lipid-binding SYLF domain-containing protein
MVNRHCEKPKQMGIGQTVLTVGSSSQAAGRKSQPLETSANGYDEASASRSSLDGRGGYERKKGARILKAFYPIDTGLSTAYSSNTGDERLKEIKNYVWGMLSNTPLSKFDYTYNAVGTIATWEQQQDSDTPTQYALGYDGADQLVSAVQSNTSTSATVSSNAYNYDPAGNRLAETTLSGVTGGQFNNLKHEVGIVPPLILLGDRITSFPISRGTPRLTSSMKFIALLSFALLTLSTALVRADSLHQRIFTATRILEERQGSLSPIPLEVLAHARGVAIGTITKAGLGIGGQGGEGIVVLHYLGDKPATWSPPVAFNTSGGSLGAQIGFTTIRYIIILNSDDAVRLFTSPGKMTFDATATGTAGADTGREGETTGSLERRAMIIYKETGGLFGGATFGGTSIEVKDEINQAAYGDHVYVRDILAGKVQAPRSAKRLDEILTNGR